MKAKTENAASIIITIGSKTTQVPVTFPLAGGPTRPNKQLNFFPPKLSPNSFDNCFFLNKFPPFLLTLLNL